MRILCILVVAWLSGPAVAQKPDTPESKPSAAERMQELEDLRAKAMSEWRESLKAARSGNGNATRAIRMRPDYGPVAQKALAYADEFAGTDEAVGFLLMVIDLDQAKARPAVATLLKDHLQSPKLKAMGPMMVFLDRLLGEAAAADALEKLITGSPSADVRGWALFARHRGALLESDVSSKSYKSAREAVVAACEKAGDQRLLRQVNGLIDEREKFGIGCTAPDIEGVDLDGVAFKLSDYKGKVIFLDFWGHW